MGKMHGVCQNSRGLIRCVLDESELQQEPMRNQRVLEQERICLAERKIKRDEQIRNMPAIKDKETGKRRELTREEKERTVNNKDEARGRRLRKLRIVENKAKTEEGKEHRKNEAEEEEIDEALAELVDKWNAEARNRDENTNEAEEDAERSQSRK